MAYCTWCGSNQMQSGVDPYFCSSECSHEAEKYDESLVEIRKQQGVFVTASGNLKEDQVKPDWCCDDCGGKFTHSGDMFDGNGGTYCSYCIAYH